MSNITGETNYSWVLRSINDIQLENRPRPNPKPHEVQVAISATGICGSDVHYWAEGKLGSFIVKNPMVLGHESMGVVTKVGKEVTTFKIGDNVVVEPGVPCYKCQVCKRGNYNLCPDMQFAATPPVDGTLCQYYCSPADLCVKLPENFPLGQEGGALIEPLSVGIHACKRGELKAGQTVMVFGAGPVGLLCGAVAKASGAIKIIMVDISQMRLDFAKTYIADEIILAGPVESGKSVMEHSKSFSDKLLNSGHERVDIVLECSGAETSIQTGIFMTKPGGNFVQVGIGKDTVSFPISHLCINEINVKGTFRYANAHHQAVQMVTAGLIDLAPLITHRFKFQEAVKAFETVRDRKDGVIKALILAD